MERLSKLAETVFFGRILVLLGKSKIIYDELGLVHCSTQSVSSVERSLWVHDVLHRPTLLLTPNLVDNFILVLRLGLN